MTIHVLHALKDNFVYALVHKGNCAIIDPGEAGPVEDFLRTNGCTLTHVLLTHHHQDHIAGTEPLLRRHDSVEVWCSAYDRQRIALATQTAETMQHLWDLPVSTLVIPGHTLGHVAYYLPEQNALFCGDTLFSAGCGRLFEGTPEMMFASLGKIRHLPSDTMIYFGHEYTLRNLEFVELNSAAEMPIVKSYVEQIRAQRAAGGDTTPTTLARELQVNPFLRAQSVAEFTRWRELRNHF